MLLLWFDIFIEARAEWRIGESATQGSKPDGSIELIGAGGSLGCDKEQE